jgi:hypothetical protein
LRDEVFRKDIRERQISVLQKLTPQKLDLVPKPALVKMVHPWASLPLMGLSQAPSKQDRPSLPMSF